MQAPVFVSSKEYVERMYSLVSDTATDYKERNIIIRPHPEFGVSEIDIKLSRQFGNIAIDETALVEDIYRKTQVAVSHYSSCLVESVQFNCTPLMFNPTYNFDYPLLPERNKAVSENEFKVKLDNLLTCTAKELVNYIDYSGDMADNRFEMFLRILGI